MLVFFFFFLLEDLQTPCSSTLLRWTALSVSWANSCQVIGLFFLGMWQLLRGHFLLVSGVELVSWGSLGSGCVIGFGRGFCPTDCNLSLPTG